MQANYFGGEKRTPVSKKSKLAPQTSPILSHRPMSTTLVSERRDFDESLSHMNSSQHLGTAVKQLAPTDLQSPLIFGKTGSGSSGNAASVQLKRNLGMRHGKVWEGWVTRVFLAGRITFVVVVGCIVFATLKLTSMKGNETRIASKHAPSKPNSHTSSIAWTTDSCVDVRLGPAYIKGNGLAGGLEKFLVPFMKQVRNCSDVGNPPVSHTSSSTSVCRRPMSVEEAEDLVKQWQGIKAEALGPSHEIQSLSDVLDESMLVQVLFLNKFMLLNS